MIASVIYIIIALGVIRACVVFVYQWVRQSYIGFMKTVIRFGILTRDGLSSLIKVNIKMILSVGKPM